MDGKAVYGLPAAFGGSRGHKNGVFRVTRCPWGQPRTQKRAFLCCQLSLAAKIFSNSTLQNSDCAPCTTRIV